LSRRNKRSDKAMRRENRQWHALYTTAERKANTPTLYLNDDIPAREGMAEIEPLELVKAWNYLRELLAHVRRMSRP
jgi:hypothetical protein